MTGQNRGCLVELCRCENADQLMALNRLLKRTKMSTCRLDSLLRSSVADFRAVIKHCLEAQAIRLTLKTADRLRPLDLVSSQPPLHDTAKGSSEIEQSWAEETGRPGKSGAIMRQSAGRWRSAL